jgi:hypothetical protein
MNDRNPARPEVHVSTDVEIGGPIPGENSMLPLGSAAFDADGAYAAMGSRAFGASAKRNLPKEWNPPRMRHTRVVSEKARGQALLYVNVRAALRDAVAFAGAERYG